MAKGLRGRTVSGGERERLTHTHTCIRKKKEKKENRGVEEVAGHEGNNL